MLFGAVWKGWGSVGSRDLSVIPSCTSERGSPEDLLASDSAKRKGPKDGKDGDGWMDEKMGAVLERNKMELQNENKVWCAARGTNAGVTMRTCG